MEDASQWPSLLIAWHSRTGASEAMARAAYDAAQTEVDANIVRADDVSPEMILAASAYLFVCPENLGSLSGVMKELFDRCFYPVLGRIEGRAYASIIAAGSDGEGALRQLDRIATGWRLKRVADPLIVSFESQTPETILAPKTVPADAISQCRQIGLAIGAGAAMGMF